MKNEKIICKSNAGIIAANPLAILCFIIAFLGVISSFITASCFTLTTPIEWIIRNFDLYVWFYIGALLFIGIGILLLVLLKPELIVTDARVYGKIGAIKKVDLPLNQISAIGTGILNCVTIATSSGKIRFWGIINHDKIANAVSELLAETHKNAVPKTTVITSISNAEELKIYKELLDTGVITKEEFDAKKKQLLGL